MRKASNILLKIGMILNIVLAVLLVVSAALSIVVGVSSAIHEMIIDGVNNGDIQSNLTAEQAAILVQSLALSFGICSAIFAVVATIGAVISSQTLREPTKGRYIACIVLGAFASNVTTVGGVFGLIADGQDRRRARAIEE